MSDGNRVARTRFRIKGTNDSFENFAARVGLNTDNPTQGSQYGLNPITRQRVQLEFMYRSSWIIRNAIGVPADDMVRAGIEITGDITPSEIEELQAEFLALGVWDSLADAVRWGRLYGGALAVHAVDGQNAITPLRKTALMQGQYKGLTVFDRWQIQPSQVNFIQTMGPDFGHPMFYKTLTQPDFDIDQTFHYSRCARFLGEDLPYQQRRTEMGWGMSIIEPILDRLVSYDSTTMGIAQLVYRAYLRTLKMKNLRNNIATGGKQFEAALTQVDLIRRYQTNEGLTLLDAEDEMSTHTFSFGGLPEVLVQFAQQISGATGIPIVKLFGQSPAGFSTGDTDLRSYYDNIGLRQKRNLRRVVLDVVILTYISKFGKQPPANLNFKFNPLWEMDNKDKSSVAVSTGNAVAQAFGNGTIDKVIAAKELKQSADRTGIFTNITDEFIAKLEKQQKEAEATAAAAPPGFAPNASPDDPNAPGTVHEGNPVPTTRLPPDDITQGPAPRFLQLVKR